MPQEAREKVEREINRLARTAAQSPESSVSQNYIEYMLELPWGVKQETQIDIPHARKVVVHLLELARRALFTLLVLEHAGGFLDKRATVLGT